MKKSRIIIAGMFLLAFTVQSCKKTYTCTCYYSDGTSDTQTLKGGSLTELKSECLEICN